MRTLLRFFVVFFAVIGATAVMAGLFNVQFRSLEYWDHHGVLFLMAVALFPRLTLAFAGFPFSGPLAWCGFLFAPRVLVAVLATVNYWNRNPLLVVIAWLVAIGGESSEKTLVIRRSGGGAARARGYESARYVESEPGA